MEFIDWESEGLNENFVGGLSAWKQFFFQGTDDGLEQNKLKTIGRFAGILTNFYMISRGIVPFEIARVGRYPNKVSFFGIVEQKLSKLNDPRNRAIMKKIREITELIKEGKVEIYQMILHSADDMGDSRKAVEELSISLKTSEGDNVKLTFGDLEYDVDFKSVGFDEFIRTFFRILCKIQGYCSSLPRLSKKHALYFKATLFEAIPQPNFGLLTAEDVKFDYSGLSNEILDETCLYRHRKDEKRLASATLFRHKPVEPSRLTECVQDYLNEIVEEEKDKNPENHQIPIEETSLFRDVSIRQSLPKSGSARKRGRQQKVSSPLEVESVRADDAQIGDDGYDERPIPRRDSLEEVEALLGTTQQINNLTVEDRPMNVENSKLDDTDAELQDIMDSLSKSQRFPKKDVQKRKKGSRGRKRK
ncbi:unnamed protein product [Bursaphelenchus xylophilus]|uniref:(pine wood nematode) hypothetical protein n=1 Tax=Bursaphelenchus xylophilus TaxID=6326 RepID=A0A1I7RI37_BURXY|nr:unnamed protein product [Bursaphelenchus xylophilus]CAG9115178.1 unnamed protein product [Bursaphelenchus xylophilus]